MDVPARRKVQAGDVEPGRPRRRWLLFALVPLSFLAGALFGAAAMKQQWPPYESVRWLYYRLSPPPAETVVPDLDVITIQGPGDVGRLRSGLVRTLWGTDALPTRLPDRVERGISDPRFSGSANLARIDRLTVAMEFGLDSKVYRLVPRRANGHLVLYHRGHGDEAPSDHRTIDRLISSGYEVAVFWMPLFGDNARPIVRHPRLGTLRIGSHDQLRFLRPAAGHPVKFFVEPVVVSLNHLLQGARYRSVSMIGLSGGGWTTTLAAALDPRIARSFPVAGSYPLSLRRPGDFGDFEQTSPTVYNMVNYYELYILGAVGPGRRQLQILNEFDPCCFGGREAELYRDPLNAIVRAIGPGSFDVTIDSSHAGHEISPAALQRILGEIGA